MIRILLPVHLRRLAGVEGEIQLDLPDRSSPTLGEALDALENAHPVLRGTIRDHHTLQRRPFVRYFACEQDLSHQPPHTPLPDPILQAKEPLLIVGAMAGG
jgi:sulfur-carrier protein